MKQLSLWFENSQEIHTLLLVNEAIMVVQPLLGSFPPQDGALFPKLIPQEYGLPLTDTATDVPLARNIQDVIWSVHIISEK
jgi:hypothetical protein